VELINATVQGGTLNNRRRGTLETISTAELDGSTQGALTISSGSTYTASDNTTTYLLGTIVNRGLIQQNRRERPKRSPGYRGPVTLTGGGTVLLDTISTNGGNAFIEGNGETLTNTNNTILGTGIIGNGSLALINERCDRCDAGGTIGHLDPDAERLGWRYQHRPAGGHRRRRPVDRDQCHQHGREHHCDRQPQCGELISNSATRSTGGTLSTVSGGTHRIHGHATLQGVTIAAGSTVYGERQHHHDPVGHDRQPGYDRADRRERPERVPGSIGGCGHAHRWRNRAAGYASPPTAATRTSRATARP
jgi:hypothetical protein